MSGHKHDTKNRSRLDDAVLRNCKFKRPNAQKGGMYTKPLIIPGENLSEFEELCAEEVAYWRPAGPPLRDAAFDLADMKWRKRRLTKYVQTELCLTTFDPRHPAFNEVWGFTMFMECLRSKPQNCFDEHAKKYLRADKIDYLKQRFPRGNYQSISEWAEAITAEIYSVLLPAIPGLKPCQRRGEVDDVLKRTGLDDVLEQAAREWRTDQQVAASISYSRELLEYELRETERLNAMIVKQTRYCAELKAWEEPEEMRNKT